jgi:hypothetical protein
MSILKYFRGSRSNKSSPAERNRAFAQAFLPPSETRNSRRNANANPRKMFGNLKSNNWTLRPTRNSNNPFSERPVPVSTNVNNTRVSQSAARTLGLMPWRMPRLFTRGSRLQRSENERRRRRPSLTLEAAAEWRRMAPNINDNPFSIVPPSSVARPEPDNNPFLIVPPSSVARPEPFDPFANHVRAPRLPASEDPFAGGRRTRRKIKARKL